MFQYMIDLSGITQVQARHVLAHFGEGGYRAGTFTMSLIETIARADPPNKARLREVYPAYVDAVWIAQNELDGCAQLKEIADDPRTDAQRVRHERIKAAVQAAEEWDRLYPVGTPVTYWPSDHWPGDRTGPGRAGATVSKPWVDGIRAFVRIDSCEGAVSLSNVQFRDGGEEP
jgi:hypothetical protein